MMHEVRAKHLGDGENPLGVADVGDHLVLEEGGELGRALGAAGGTEPPSFAGKREQELGSAAGAADAGEASLEDAAVEVPRDDPVQDGAPEAVAGLEEILPGPLDDLEEGLEQLVERGLGGPAGAVDAWIHEWGTSRISCRRTDPDASGSMKAV